MAGVCTLTLPAGVATAGTTISMLHAEMLNTNGSGLVHHLYDVRAHASCLPLYLTSTPHLPHLPAAQVPQLAGGHHIHCTW